MWEHDLLEFYLNEVQRILENLYFPTRRNKVPKSLAFYSNVLPGLSPDRFEQFFRMSVDGFFRIVSLVEGDIVFRNNSNSSQVSPCKQLAVALRRFACESSSGSNGCWRGRVWIRTPVIDVYQETDGPESIRIALLLQCTPNKDTM